jgi:hypothetical protein
MTILRSWIASSDFTILRAELVRALGGNAAAALVLTRILWRCEGPYSAGDGWWRVNRKQLAEETGLSVDQVKRLVNKLVADGHLDESKQRTDGEWDQTISYRVAIDEMSESAHVAISPNGSGDIAESMRRNRQMDVAGSPNVHVAESPNVPVSKDSKRRPTRPSASENGNGKPKPSTDEQPVPLAVANGNGKAKTITEESPAAAMAHEQNLRSQALARIWTELVPLSKFPAVMGICKRAIAANKTDTEIEAALRRMAAENRPLTVDTLRIELEGLPVGGGSRFSHPTQHPRRPPS